MEENWKDVVGYEGRYQVSSLGRVKSLRFRGHAKESVLKSTPNYSGYHVVTLGVDRKQFRVHVLVLEAFLGKRPDGHEGCHGDGDKNNNALTNLRWDTPSGNAQDRRSYSGCFNPNAKLSKEQVEEIASAMPKGKDVKLYAEKFGVSTARIYQIMRGFK